MNPNGNRLAPIIKELHMESCQRLEAFNIFPALKKMQKLEVLSMAGIASANDEFVSELLAYLGCDLKEISLFGCG